MEKMYTREELQRFAVETALGYYFQNPDVQYDSLIVADGHKHLTSGDAPETASRDDPVYSVCSDYMYDIWHDAFGYEMMGGPKKCATKWMAALPADDPRVVCRFGGADGEQDIEKAMNRVRDSLEPGDMIVGYGKSGHIMMYLGDVCGETDRIIHCWGAAGDRVTGKDRYEENGAIVLQSTDECLFRPHRPKTPGWFLASPKKNAQFAVLRMLDAPDFVPQPTSAALTRVRYPGITVKRFLDRTIYRSIADGEEIPVTVTVTNNGKEDYAAVPVTEHLPEGQTLLSADGADVSGEDLRWTANIPAGQTASFSYRVRVTGKPGQTLVFPAGEVAGLRSRRISMRIGKKPLCALHSGVRLPETTGYCDLSYVNLFYRKNYGTDPGLPETVSDFLSLTLQHRPVPSREDPEKTVEVVSAREDSPLARMILPRHVTGYYADTHQDSRSYITAYREEYYLPGDVFLALSGENIHDVTDPDAVEIFLYLGNGNVLSYTRAGGAELRTFAETVDLALKYNLFVGLRPSLTCGERRDHE